MHNQFSSTADFLCVYIAEAHASDEWPMDPAAGTQHRNVAERVAAASRFADEHQGQFSWPIACDTMDGDFLQAFGAWPTRFFVIADGKLAFKLQPSPEGRFNPRLLQQWLARRAAATC